MFHVVFHSLLFSSAVYFFKLSTEIESIVLPAATFVDFQQCDMRPAVHVVMFAYFRRSVKSIAFISEHPGCIRCNQLEKICKD